MLSMMNDDASLHYYKMKEMMPKLIVDDDLLLMNEYLDLMVQYNEMKHLVSNHSHFPLDHYYVDSNVSTLLVTLRFIGLGYAITQPQQANQPIDRSMTLKYEMRELLTERLSKWMAPTTKALQYFNSQQ
jgi:hypothetical protein